ncbi:MAG: serine/threonine-protein kinase [Bacillota bacterium]
MQKTVKNVEFNYELDLGKIYFDKYQVVKKLKKGSQGKVYLVKNIFLDSLWILKLVKNNDNIFKEEGILKLINSRYFPKIVDIFYKDDFAYIIEEYVEGKTLEKYFNENLNMETNEIIHIGKEIAKALNYLHKKNIIYRDLSPDNIIITPLNKIIIIDLGFCKFNYLKRDEKKSFKSYYISPETRNTLMSNEKSDIYSLGMVLKRGILGKNFFEFSDKYFKKVTDKNLFKVIKKATNKKSNNRYSFIKDFLDDLKNVEKGLRKKEVKNVFLKGILVGFFISILIKVVRIYLF